MQQKSTWTSDAPLVIAHRGASLHAPENTIAAFRLAQDLGADAIEFDVKLTRDGIPVVLHDMTLDRTTTGHGLVKDHTLAQIRKLDAGVKFDQTFRGECVPTLHEVVEQFGKKILLNLELTNYNDLLDELPQKVLEVLEDAGCLENVLFSSFNPIVLARMNRMMPGVRRALLLLPNVPRIVNRLLMMITPYDDLHPHEDLISQGLIDHVHRAGGRINVWTVNTFDRISKCFQSGVDGVISDDVTIALQARLAAIS